MSDPICSCETIDHPKSLENPPGRSAIGYRVGDFASFRAALLRVRQVEAGQVGEKELPNWSPSADHDLGVQMVEWFAYLADILTFYNERIANESYLGTASQVESVRRLIRLLGYRPRPGIAATGWLAAISNSLKPFTIPQGFQIQSKPGPGKEPQIFEVDSDTVVWPTSSVAADSPAANLLASTDDRSVLLRGRVTTLRAGELVLLLPRTWSSGTFTLLTVQKVSEEKDPRGAANTRVTFTTTIGLGQVAPADYQLWRSVDSAKLYPYKASLVIADTFAVLDTIRRGILPGSKVLFYVPDNSKPPLLVLVSATGEIVYYANAPDEKLPMTPPPPPTVAVPIPATWLAFSANALPLNEDKGRVIVRFGWQEAGELIASPATNFTTSGAVTLEAVPPALFPTGTRNVLLEDAKGDGTSATGQTIDNGHKIALSQLPPTPVTLNAPLSVLLNLLSVSHGKSVEQEILGSGDATRANQEFVLKKSPLTYLADSTAPSGTGYRSTLRIWVNDVEWFERPSFYAQSPQARIFVTREDDEQKTHVRFGDGVNGARLPSGANNVVARYRYGSGAEMPEAGTLNVVVQPQPGLRAIRNPLAVAGGSDPDPSDQIKHNAPQSVLTFGRAISGTDYETLAAQTPGVDRARAYWSWESEAQQSMVTVYVGDTAGAVTAATEALDGATDPNRPIAVKLATAIPIHLALTVLVDPTYQAEIVAAQVRAALIDPEGGLFGVKQVRIGQQVYRSQIFAACLAVPGTVAVHDLQLTRNFSGYIVSYTGPRYNPGEGKFFQLDEDELVLTTEVAANG